MDRRKLLAFVLVALLAATAGCSSSGSISMDPVDDDSLAEQASNDLGILEPGQERLLVQAAIENDSTTAVGTSPPVDQQLPFRHEGAFYNISYAEAGTQSGYDVGLRIDYNASSVDGEVVDYEDLPAVDRTALEFLVTQADAPGPRLEPGYDFGLQRAYTQSEANTSVLAPDQTYDAVRYEGETYPIGVEVDSQTLTVYEYESTLVAENAAEYATALRDSYEFELSNLSDAERDVLENALNGTNYIDDSDNDGFDSLVDRFSGQQPVTEDDHSGHYVVRYEEQLYWVELQYGDYLDDDST